MIHDEQPIATLRYQKQSDEQIQFDRFCVAKDWRKRGIGREMLQLAEKRAINEAFKEIYLIAKFRRSFLRKQGYQSFFRPTDRRRHSLSTDAETALLISTV